MAAEHGPGHDGRSPVDVSVEADPDPVAPWPSAEDSAATRAYWRLARALDAPPTRIMSLQDLHHQVMRHELAQGLRSAANWAGTP